MGSIIIAVILVLITAFAIKSTVHRIRHGSSCCGERDAAPKKVKVSDKNKAHYPFTYTIGVDGMHCSNCVRHVENALNSLEGIWAAASLEKKSVEVRSKNQVSEENLKKAVLDAGYTPLFVKNEAAKAVFGDAE